MWSSLGSSLEFCILSNSLIFAIGPLRGAKTVSMMIFRITTLGIMTLSITEIICHIHHNDTQQYYALPLCWILLCWVSRLVYCYDCYAECHNAECHYAEWPYASVVMLSDIMLSDIMLSDIMLSDIMRKLLCWVT
jgi:hypothetical protein